MGAAFADKIDMQNRLFSELSRMFGEEVPLYDKSLLVNRECNRGVCELLGWRFGGFEMSDEQLERTSGERHGAIRIGRPDEYRWIARFFAQFAMEPHNFYDMTSIGAKSQPIVATAFRSVRRPEHRVFSSLLQTSYFDRATRERIEALLSEREVFSDLAKELIERGERQGGLGWDDADTLIAEGVNRIFKWTGRAKNFELYRELCDAGFKIAADIACFQSHHLNHLTPNTFCMDLYTSAMKHCLGELDASSFCDRAGRALRRLVDAADIHFLVLHFKHLSRDVIESFTHGAVTDEQIEQLVGGLVERLASADLRLENLNHAGFKDFTEGPSEDTPLLLRQDAYRALTEPVVFENPDGSTVEAEHTARFGEIEQRFYATTLHGRRLYDECLANAERAKADDPGLAKRDIEAYERLYASAFEPFPKTLDRLVEQGLVFAEYEPTAEGLARAAEIDTTDLRTLIERGLVRFNGVRYEDFLPVSAAGIFASNLNQYGTASTADDRPEYTQAMLEDIMDRPILDATATYAGVEASSILATYRRLGLLDRVPASERARLQGLVDACPRAYDGSAAVASA
ncbi:MAG: 2-oxoadipate dioxygenase/decarboxylase family protein [Phycisphaerales bacterium]